MGKHNKGFARESAGVDGRVRAVGEKSIARLENRRMLPSRLTVVRLTRHTVACDDCGKSMKMPHKVIIAKRKNFDGKVRCCTCEKAVIRKRVQDREDVRDALLATERRRAEIKARARKRR